ncbi:MAG: hypothetical protein AMS18_04490, partial [Gemmatimonas sp. SG8_17]
ESLEKVRDILFGGQMRAVDARLASLEERFQRELAAFRVDTQKQLGDTESYVKKEIAALGERLAGERAKRAEDGKALSAELKETLSTFEKRVTNLDDATSKADAELRTAVLEYSKSTSSQINQLSSDLSSELQRAVLELRGEKLDTATLIQLFSDVALHLSEHLQASQESN